MKVVVHCLSAFKQFARGYLIPVVSTRKPNGLRNLGSMHRSSDRAYQHVITEHILISLPVSLWAVRIIIVHRTAERQGLIVGFSGHRVDVRVEGITCLDDISQHTCHVIREYPRLFIDASDLSRMSPQNRTEEAELHPAGIYLRIKRSYMPTNIVTPIAGQHIRGRTVEIRLEVERSPGDDSISREAYLVTMVAQSAPTVVKHRSGVAVTLHIGKNSVINPPRVIQILHPLGGAFRFSVNPPEVNTVSLHRMQDFVCPTGHKSLV